MNQIKWVFENMKGSRRWFFLGAFLQTGIFVPLLTIGPIFLSRFVDRVFKPDGIYLDRIAIYLILSYLVVYLIRSVVYYSFAISLNKAGVNVITTLRNTLYERLSSLSPRFFSKTRTGDIMMRLTGDLDCIRHFVAWDMPQTFYGIGNMVVGLVVFFNTNWILATIILCTAPIYAGLLLLCRKLAAPLYTKLREANSHLNAGVQENIAGNRVVRAFVREEAEQKKFEKLNEDYANSAIRASMIWVKIVPFVRGLGNGSLIVILLVGGIMVIRGSMSLGDLMLFYNLNWLINGAMDILGIVLNDTQKFLSSTQKVISLYYARADIKSPEHPVPGKVPNPGRIEFKDVSFNYEKTKVLEHVNLVAEPGQTIGIMGPTGSGKTTLTMLLARFYDVNSGEVLVDGVNVKDYDLEKLRRKIGISMQDVFLFSNTIDSNIAYGNLELSEEQVKEYAKMADADSFIRKTSDGYDTIVGERGVGLSGGQKQRIALARALAYESPIVVLDDTTSALDMETELAIQQRLKERKGRYTTIIVAQRISAVRDADMIYILDNHTVAECGTHEELLAQKGYYYDIYCLQQGFSREKEGE